MVSKIKWGYALREIKNITIWGIAFKPKTDDTRCAPALTIIQGLLEKGANITTYDPKASIKVWTEAHLQHAPANSITISNNAYKAADGADALLILTEWDEFRTLDYERLRSTMKHHVIFDGRNIYKPEEVQIQGFTYFGVGRPAEIPFRTHRIIKKQKNISAAVSLPREKSGTTTQKP